VHSLSRAGFQPGTGALAAGETAKNLKMVGVCFDYLSKQSLERKSFIVALERGGVVGDLAGFVAAT